MSKPPLISALPAEILLLIFDFTCPTADVALWEDEDPLTALYLSHVCSAWRRILISTSKHWRTIHINSIPLDGPPEDMLLEYARRAKKQTLSFRVIGEEDADDLHRTVSIPRAVSKKIGTVVLPHDAHLEWLRFDGEGESLTLVYLGGPHVDDFYSEELSAEYRFDPVEDFKFYFSTTTLTCEDAGIVPPLSSPQSSSRLPFHELRRINFEYMDNYDIYDTFNSIEAPYLVSLHSEDLVDTSSSVEGTDHELEHIQKLLSGLRHLEVVGDMATYRVMEGFLHGVVSPKLEKLELYLCLEVFRTFDRLNLEIWVRI